MRAKWGNEDASPVFNYKGLKSRKLKIRETRIKAECVKCGRLKSPKIGRSLISVNPAKRNIQGLLEDSPLT